MFTAIVLQIAASVAAIAVAGWFFGWQGAVSAGMGGAICVLPNFLFALRLWCVMQQKRAPYLANFFIAEFAKVALTLGLLFLVIKKYADLHWPSLLIGMVLALQAGFLAFWKKS